MIRLFGCRNMDDFGEGITAEDMNQSLISI